MFFWSRSVSGQKCAKHASRYRMDSSSARMTSARVKSWGGGLVDSFPMCFLITTSDSSATFRNSTQVFPPQNLRWKINGILLKLISIQPSRSKKCPVWTIRTGEPQCSKTKARLNKVRTSPTPVHITFHSGSIFSNNMTSFVKVAFIPMYLVHNETERCF